MPYVDLAQAYAKFNTATSQADWDYIGNTYLDDDVVLYNYDILAGQPGHKVGPGKGLVIIELKRLRGEIKQYWPPTSVNMPPYNPDGLVPGGAAVDELILENTPNPTARRARRIQRGRHHCTDLFKFKDDNYGRIIEIHYCVTEGP